MTLAYKLTRLFFAGEIQFVLIEKEAALVLEKITSEKEFNFLRGKKKITEIHISDLYKQQLTHQTIYGQFITIQLRKKPLIKGYHQVEKAALEKLPFPKFINNYIKDKNVPLNLF